MQRIKKNDLVIVISGKDKGRTGRVREVCGKNRVIVEKVNVVKRHRKAAKDFPGGIEEKEASIHISNVMIVDPKSKDRTRVRVKVSGKDRLRVAVKSGEVIS